MATFELTLQVRVSRSRTSILTLTLDPDQICDWSFTKELPSIYALVGLDQLRTLAAIRSIDLADGVKFIHERNTSSPYFIDVPPAHFRSQLPVRDHCDLSWIVHEVDGPKGDRSLSTVVSSGIPTYSSEDPLVSPSVEVAVTFENALAMRAGEMDGLEVLIVDRTRGDLVDMMCMAGLINSDEWLRVVKIPPEVRDAMSSFSRFCSLWESEPFRELLSSVSNG